MLITKDSLWLPLPALWLIYSGEEGLSGDVLVDFDCLGKDCLSHLFWVASSAERLRGDGGRVGGALPP